MNKDTGETSLHKAVKLGFEVKIIYLVQVNILFYYVSMLDLAKLQAQYRKADKKNPHHFI